MEARIIGQRLFLDSATRDVFGEDDGRQYVIGSNGESVYGNWIFTEALVELMPVIVTALAKR